MLLAGFAGLFFIFFYSPMYVPAAGNACDELPPPLPRVLTSAGYYLSDITVAVMHVLFRCTDMTLIRLVR